MSNAVIKAVGYVLAHTPDMVVHNGTTQTTERIVNPQSEYLQNIRSALRTYEQALAYAPHQTFIGNISPDALKAHPLPWYAHPLPNAGRFGPFGEIMPQDEFIGLMQTVDAFDLVKLTEDFAATTKEKLNRHPLLAKHAEKIKPGVPLNDINQLIENMHAEPLSIDGQTVGCVKRAHDIDPNLSAHVMLENLASKASSALTLMHMTAISPIDIAEIDYVIECSEEACGDMNQRGGGNFAKSVAEAAGLLNATGSDTRGFCAAPVHALIEAASLVKAGTFKHVAVVAGGATAKLGMNGKDHVKKGLPILEDVLGAFAVLVGMDDGVSPVINTGCVGRHTVGSGSAPQAVITSLTAAPLERAGLRLTDVDKYAAELQNPDITKPAGAGDVPEANYKMIAALSVMRKEIERPGIPAFIEKHGMPGFAPTQGHIPSGVPFLGFAREGLTAGELQKVMIIGKGSLFLGRMTNLFDGISVLLERNSSSYENATKTEGTVAKAVDTPKMYRVGITVNGSEHGAAELIEGALLAVQQNDNVEVVLIGEDETSEKHTDASGHASSTTPAHSGINNLPDRITWVNTPAHEAHRVMEQLLDSSQIDACVTMHYSFPIGVTTIGKAITPGQGRSMLIASTTGTSATEKIEAMVLNAIYGIAAAKATGIQSPSVGILNVDGAVKTRNTLVKLQEGGYDLHFSESVREDGGALMRGNDLLRGAAHVMVTDTLTGNILMKTLSAFSTGGTYESTGSGYGPGLGEDYRRLILILSRASGSPVAANAIRYAVELVKGQVLKKLADEINAARKAGLDSLLADLRGKPTRADKDNPQDTDALHNSDAPHNADKNFPAPAKEVVTFEITGIDILSLEDAVQALLRAGVYADSGMGCTGPVVLVSETNSARAKTILQPYL